MLTILLILVGATACYYLLFRSNESTTSTNNDTSKISLDKPTDEEQQAGQDQKQKTVENDSSSKDGTDSSASLDSSMPIPVTLTANARNGDIYQLRYLVEENLGSGTCTLTLTKSGQTITKTAAIQPSASSSTCQGFNVPMNELSTGQWQSRLHIQAGDRSGETAATLTIE